MRKPLFATARKAFAAVAVTVIAVSGLGTVAAGSASATKEWKSTPSKTKEWSVTATKEWKVAPSTKEWKVSPSTKEW